MMRVLADWVGSTTPARTRPPPVIRRFFELMYYLVGSYTSPRFDFRARLRTG
jgi:hypothetical protein